MIRLVCPVEAAHGPVLPVKDPESRYGWFCPHAAHDGRLAGHPQGPAPRTRAHFTTDEIHGGALRSRLDDSTADLRVGARGDARAESGAPGIAPAGDHGATEPPSRGPRANPSTPLRPGAEPSGVTRNRSADAPRATPSDGDSPETEWAIAQATPGRASHPGQLSSARESAARPAVAPVCRAGARDSKHGRRARAVHHLIQACEPGDTGSARSGLARLGALDLFPETPGHPGHATG